MRKLSVFFTVALAMLLTVALAAPASAVDSWWDQYANKTTNQVQYKYGIDYHKLPSSPVNGAPVTGTGPATPVSPTVNPSATGPSSYLQQYQNRVTSPVNQPLTGKIIEPGKTLVRAPSTYATAAKFALNTVPGWSRLVGGIGVGMGGATLAPANARDIAINQGVPASCADNVKTCTRTDLDKMLAINSCGHLSGAQSCDSIGAVGYQGETAANQWFKDTVLAPLDELWAKITGQITDTTPSDVHVDIAPRYCYRQAGYEPLGPNLGKVHYRTEVTKARPASGAAAQAAWDTQCGAANAEKNAGAQGSINTECVDPATGAFGNGGGTYGLVNAGFQSSFSQPGDTSKSLCTGRTGVPANLVLFRLEIFNPITQAILDSSGGQSIYVLIKYAEWVNPDPLLNSTEDTTLSTSWDCRDFLGGTRTYTRTVKKTAAMVAPTCPLGSELVKHDIKATGPDGVPKTIDAGAEVPGNVAKYPDCSAVGCTLQVAIDGVACTAGTAACHNWPAINQVTPSRVQCKYGTYTAPTSDCVALSNAYKSESGVVFDPRAQTWVAIDTYGNPIAPNPEPWNPTNPNPVPGTPPGTATPTTPGTGTGFPGSGTSPSDNCVSPSWSWNPVDWVKSPVICALQDAFVPKTDITARIDTLSTLTTTHPPFSWFTPVFTGPSGGGCPNWVVTVPGLGSKNVVCESSFTAAIVGARGPMFGLVAAAMVWPLIRSLWYAAIPILRVTPSGR